MDFKLDTLAVAAKTMDGVMLGVFAQGELSTAAQQFDKASRGYISKIIDQYKFSADLGQTLVLTDVPHVSVRCIILVGCGKKTSLSATQYTRMALGGFKALLRTPLNQIGCYLLDIAVEKGDLAWKIKQTVAVAEEAFYSFDQFKSRKELRTPPKKIVLHVPAKQLTTAAKNALKLAEGIAAGVTYTKNLANLPSNVCTPTYLAKQAQQLAKEYRSITTKVLDEKAMKKLGMNALLAVAQGSEQEAKLLCLQYHGTSAKQQPIAIIGKGITFDTGGISLKPSESMVGMKYDMCGAATVLGTLRAAAELKLPINLVGICAATENMPSGTACKPEDIVTTLSGQTVEIMNTDAEGRLVLCDAMTYAERYKPKLIIDIATLTGAVVIALGYHATGLLTNNDALGKALIAAGLEVHDRAWQLPLWEEYQDQLRSPFADMSNVGGRAAGTITAACFLSRFAKRIPWAHLDVAGTAAMMGGNDRFATGRPVPLLIQFLMNQAQHKDKF